MNSKSIYAVFLVVFLFFLYTYVFMVSWNNGFIFAFPGLLSVDFSTSCWIMLGIFLLKLTFMKYPEIRRQSSPE